YQGLGVLPQLCTSLGKNASGEQIASLEKGILQLGPALERHRAARAPVPPAEVVEQRAACPAAEGKEQDLAIAKFLVTHPAAYAAALLRPPIN
ncbi:MAG: peptidase S41, partial [Pseudomonadota bacterium]|nr:peptidase S41 [Pseudomonadota bacterium]